MSPRAASWLAWSLCALGVALAAASPILALLNGRTLAEIFMAWGPSILTLATLTVSFSVVGALIASHRPENPIGWIFLAVGFFNGLLTTGEEYAIYALLTNRGALPLGAEFSWLMQWIWAPGLGLILVFLPLLFPNGHPPSGRWRWVAWLGGLSIGLICVPASIVLWPERGPALVGPEGVAEEGTSHALFVVVDLVALPMLLLAGLGAMTSVLVRFRRARGDERQQIKWFAAAAALTLVWYLVFGQSTRELPEAIVALASILVLQTIPVATGIAILRYRLYDIDRIINRTLVYGALTAMLAAVYLSSVALLQYFFRALSGQGSTFAVVASTLVIAALFNPLRRRIQSFIDRSFYRSKYDAAKTLEEFSMKLREETDLQALSDDLVGVVRETMQPAHVSLWLRSDTPRKGEQAV